MKMTEGAASRASENSCLSFLARSRRSCCSRPLGPRWRRWEPQPHWQRLGRARSCRSREGRGGGHPRGGSTPEPEKDLRVPQRPDHDLLQGRDLLFQTAEVRVTDAVLLGGALRLDPVMDGLRFALPESWASCCFRLPAPFPRCSTVRLGLLEPTSPPRSSGSTRPPSAPRAPPARAPLRLRPRSPGAPSRPAPSISPCTACTKGCHGFLSYSLNTPPSHLATSCGSSRLWFCAYCSILGTSRGSPRR